MRRTLAALILLTSACANQGALRETPPAESAAIVATAAPIATPLATAAPATPTLAASPTCARCTLSGRVTTPQGIGVAGVSINVFACRPSPTCGPEAGEGTDEEGRYRVTLAPGTYRIAFPFGRTRWWPNADAYDGATPIVVNADVVGIDLTLEAYRISGQINVLRSGCSQTTSGFACPAPGVGAGLAPLRFIVQAYECPGSPQSTAGCQRGSTAATAVTGSNSFRYSFYVPPGTYRVYFDDNQRFNVFEAQWWNGASSYDSATPITLSADLTGVDATFR